MIEFCSDDLEISQELPEQFSIIGQGAQYIVGMLTGPEDDLFIGRRDEELAPRVLKVPLPRSHVALAVDGMNVENSCREAKVNNLIQLRQFNVLHMTIACSFDDALYHFAGRPHQVTSFDYTYDLSERVPMEVHEYGNTIVTLAGFYPGYTQDYSLSMTPIIQSECGEPDGERLKLLIDEYAQLQRILIARGFFDDIFKLDNYGYTPNGITIHDFSELAVNVSVLADAIRTKKWEQITENKEYTQLTPNMQDYFNDKLEKTLTKSVISTWNSQAFGSSPRPMLPDIIPARCIDKIMDQL